MENCDLVLLKAFEVIDLTVFNIMIRPLTEILVKYNVWLPGVYMCVRSFECEGGSCADFEEF